MGYLLLQYVKERISAMIIRMSGLAPYLDLARGGRHGVPVRCHVGVPALRIRANSFGQCRGWESRASPCPVDPTTVFVS